MSIVNPPTDASERSSDVVRFKVPGRPVGKARPRLSTRHGRTRLHTEPKSASYESLVALAAEAALGARPQLTGALQIALTVRLEPAAYLSKRRRASLLEGRWAPRTPDLDNVLKAVLDGCAGVAFGDDAAVCRIGAEKVYATCAGVDVEIARLEPSSQSAPTPVHLP